MNVFSFIRASVRTLMILMAMTMALPMWALSGGRVGEADDFAYNSETFKQMMFEWVDNSGVAHVSDLTEEATDREHIKALMREVYGNRRVPGSKYIKYFDLPADATVATLSNPGELKVYDAAVTPTAEVIYGPYPELGLYDESYLPDTHGVTALLVEVNVPEFMEYPTDSKRFNMGTYLESRYNELTGEHFDGREIGPEWILDNTDIIKSVRVLTERTHIKDGPNPGYLFNVDQQLRHFFIVLKGEPRRLDRPGSGSEVKADIFAKFEQIAPTTDYHPEHSTLDYLRNGQKYQVIHDCSSVMLQSHFFSMNQVPHVGDFTAEENVFIYVPEARMTQWDASMPYVKELKEDYGLLTESDERDAYGSYTYYNPAYAPFLFLYNIKLGIEGGLSTERPNHHDVKLTWSSSFTDITQAVEGEVEEEFYIYRVDEDGAVSPTPIGYDEVEWMIPADQAGVTRVVRDEQGYLKVSSFRKNVSIHLFEPHNATEDPSRTLGYMVSGCIADKDYVPVVSNSVQHHMYSTQLKVVAEVDRELTRSDFVVGEMVNNYVHAIRMSRRADADREIEKNDLTVGSRFYLMRTDGNSAKDAKALGYLEINDILAGENGSGEPVYEYSWEIIPMTDYVGGKLSAVKLTGKFESRRTGDLDTDLRATVMPADGSMVYAVFTDTFSASVKGNSHPGLYNYYFDFDPAGAMLPDGTPIEATQSNTVGVTIPRSSLKGGLKTYSRAEIELDAEKRHLNPNSTKADMVVADNAQIHEYEVYLQSRGLIAHLVRNNSGRYDIMVKTPDNRDEISAGSIQSGVAEVPCNFESREGEKYYGRIVAANGSNYGVDYADAVKGPSVNIDRLTVYRVNDVEAKDGRHFVSHKNLSHDKEVKGYDTYYHHYNVWRRVDNVVSAEGETLRGEETLIRSHESRPHVNDGVDWTKDFNTFEIFYLDERAGNDSHFHSDGFLTEDVKDVPKVTYTVRVYIEMYDETAARYAAPRFAVAQAVETELHREQTTGVDSVAGNVAEGLGVTSLGGGAIRIDGTGLLTVYNVAGVAINRISDGLESRTLTLSPGLYIVSNGVESVKAQVR